MLPRGRALQELLEVTPWGKPEVAIHVYPASCRRQPSPGALQPWRRGQEAYEASTKTAHSSKVTPTKTTEVQTQIPQNIHLLGLIL